MMKINERELIHYLVGGIVLIAAWQPLMDYFQNDVVLTGVAWLLFYIITDQILHVVVKGEKISIVK